MNINQDYSRFYKGTEELRSYGTGDAASKKDTLVRYEFSTTDERGNKVMERMSKEETLRAMRDISSQYGDNVIVEFSGDGMAALVESKKGIMDRPLSQEEEDARAAKQAAFDEAVVHLDRKVNYLPEYSGIYAADKAIAAAAENCSKDQQAFVYDIIRQNFLISNCSSMTEEERQANISQGLKKAEYAAENFIPEKNRKSFLEAMDIIAELARAGKADADGRMDYGVPKVSYLGHGSNLVYTTDSLDMMRTIDAEAYTEYQRISRESSDEERPLNTLKFLLNWYENTVKKNPELIDRYEKSMLESRK